MVLLISDYIFKIPKILSYYKKCPHQAITYDFQFFELTSLSVLCCNVRVSILDVAGGKTAIFLGLPFASNGNGQTAIDGNQCPHFDPKWPKLGGNSGENHTKM